MPRHNRRKDTPPNPARLNALLEELRRSWREAMRGAR